MISERGKIFFLVTVVGLVLFGALRNDILHKLLLVEKHKLQTKIEYIIIYFQIEIL